ncbi:CKS1 [Sanghuangporus sanghuang]|uniref:Cyclin-dependent kinases regulatory subunit n=1 Tax=Sanghuangporus baumii TaxID=108892 RepID=A0A9Q5HXV3_SANBA|nr:CKS-domain-containing protein [Sanghuangporus baumii]
MNHHDNAQQVEKQANQAGNASQLSRAEALKRWEDYVDKIHYSERYSDDKYEYRHVILPKPLMKLIPKQYYNPDQSGTLRLLSEDEWRAIGITQSYGWVHYEVHTPEPHVLLFRRELNKRPQRKHYQH